MNTEAQNNISSILQKLIDRKQLGLVGVEGSFRNFDFSRFRRYPNKQIAKQVVEDFLNQNLLAAPSFVGVTSPVEPPLFIGIDDEEHYDANLLALHSALAQRDAVRSELHGIKQRLAEEKKENFLRDLRSFDDLEPPIIKETLDSVPIYENWPAIKSDIDLVIEQFLEAYGLELTLDFQKVEHERRLIIEKLIKTLSKDEVSDLVRAKSRLSHGKNRIWRVLSEP
jgi:hypothetical protein